jgi:nucleoside-diphosphate-sugar epimerase
MGKTLVTGVAGFIGSHLAERLVGRGRDVIGVDSFTDYYARERKEDNLRHLVGDARFQLIEADLARDDLDPILENVTSVCHLAAQAGVRASWGRSFDTYLECNVSATQRLLETIKDRTVSKFVYASSSSVYGQTDDLPMRETGATRPVSPYGVTKLAGEHLAVLYHKSYGVPTVSLRYFTVYGPRQRPDMAFHRFVRAALTGGRVAVYGDGLQTRDFTYIDDIVAATERALTDGPPGEIINVGGGSRVRLADAIRLIERELGHAVETDHEIRARGDVTDTMADNGKAERLLGFHPEVGLEEGLARQCEWMRSILT